MRILMMTNTYLPHVGGVANSVQAFTTEYRRLGHRVVVVCPDFEGQPEDEVDVLRVPAIPNFNESGFSVSIPIPGFVDLSLGDFEPEIIHSHHPFLLGDTAVRYAARQDLPIVFTHHTMYEHYTHYMPGDSPQLVTFIKELTVGYANLCDHVFAPSHSVAEVIRERGITTPVSEVPTGVDVHRFGEGDGAHVRAELGIPEAAFVVGHVGRLSPEKNLEFLGDALTSFLRSSPEAHALIVGDGASRGPLRERFAAEGLGARTHLPGVRREQELVDAYHAMDLFAFTSLSETQGMVLAEAMAAGVPCVALDAPGAREVVRTDENGVLVAEATPQAFLAALVALERRGAGDLRALQAGARETSRAFSVEATSRKALSIYEEILASERENRSPEEESFWNSLLRVAETEFEIWSALGWAAGSALTALGADEDDS